MTDLPSEIKREIEEKRKVVGATKIEQERWRKKNVGETMEKLDELGQEDQKKGREAVQKAYKEYEKENFRIKSDRILWLNQKAKRTQDRKQDYYIHVHTIVLYELSFLDVPPGYTVKSEVTEKGIKFTVRDRWGSLHMGGFTPCGMGRFDEQACRTSVNKIDDLIMRLENNPPSGVYLPWNIQRKN